MKLPNLKDLMISISEVKQQLSEVVNKKMTKVIVKNNEPVSIIMPYTDYIQMAEKVLDNQNLIKGIGQDITLSNGVQIMVLVETSMDKTKSEEIAVKTYVKMKTSGDYKLHYTLYLNNPNVESTMTIEEIIKKYETEKI